MKQGYWIILSNTGGELCRRFADTEEDTVEIAHALLSELPYLSDGDIIRVVEGQAEDRQTDLIDQIRRKS